MATGRECHRVNGEDRNLLEVDGAEVASKPGSRARFVAGRLIVITHGE
jgi:hypothetical protein